MTTAAEGAELTRVGPGTVRVAMEGPCLAIVGPPLKAGLLNER
jgi:hypothetical protein